MSWLKLDTTIKPIYAKSLEEFNSYVDKYKAPYELILTKSNNISQANLRNLPCCKTWKRANHMEFQYIDGQQQIRILYAIHYDEKSNNSEDISYKALQYFPGLLEVIPTDDVEEDIEIFKCPDALTDSNYYNYYNDRYTDITLEHCYSLDRNSSFLASMLEVYPKTKNWVDKFQNDKTRIKAIPKELRTKRDQEILQYDKIFIGWLNNPKYHRHKAWKKIINNSNLKVHQLRKDIEAHGNTVLVVNTDAVKFINYYPYTESKDLGKFKYEWFDTNMYVKSVKSYAYFDKDKYKWCFKQAGKCRLDTLKPREEWTLEDFKSKETFKIAKIVVENNRLVEKYV